MHHGPARHDAGWRRDPGSRRDPGTRYGLRPRHGPRSPAGRGTWAGPPGRRAAGWRADPGRGTAGLRRFWPAAMTPAAIAACTLGAVALAGLIVIAVSVAVAASAPGGLAASGSLSQALEACSGELALLALTVAVVLGVAATERHVLPAATRVTTQLAHRAVALIAVGFLIVHILLETVSDQAGPLAAVLPFSDASDRLYLGLGTIASDLVIAIIGTSLARMRYARSAHPQLWRMVHRSIYVAWPLAILHGILEGGGPVWAAWAYGICAALVAVAISARVRMRDPAPRAPGADLADLADLGPCRLVPGRAARRWRRGLRSGRGRRSRLDSRSRQGLSWQGLGWQGPRSRPVPGCRSGRRLPRAAGWPRGRPHPASRAHSSRRPVASSREATTRTDPGRREATTGRAATTRTGPHRRAAATGNETTTRTRAGCRRPADRRRPRTRPGAGPGVPSSPGVPGP